MCPAIWPCCFGVVVDYARGASDRWMMLAPGKVGSVLSRTADSKHAIVFDVPLREVRSGSDTD